MAKKEEKKLERVYNVPLRKGWLKVPKYKRAKKAVKTLREFLIRHMKPAEDEKGRLKLKIGKMANLDIWKHGIKNPPHHLQVKVTKDSDGTVRAELVGFEYKDEKKVEKKEKGKVEAIKEKLMGKSKVVKKEEPKKEETSQGGKSPVSREETTELEKSVEMPKEEPKKEEKPPEVKNGSKTNSK